MTSIIGNTLKCLTGKSREKARTIRKTPRMQAEWENSTNGHRVKVTEAGSPRAKAPTGQLRKKPPMLYGEYLCRLRIFSLSISWSLTGKHGSAICLETLRDDDPIRLLSCDHIFHSSCLAKWFLKRHETCPLCKASFMRLPDKPKSPVQVPERAHTR